MLALVALAGDARAQRAPEGNAHPASKQISEGEATNPFGAVRESSFDIASKRAFARDVNLEPLRGVG